MARQSRELIIDSFAGGGGASLGIAWATGRAPDIAINHDADALAMHEANHPSTLHVREDVWKTNLPGLVGGKKVGMLWISPQCTHFSRARGGKPVTKQQRSLAWVACKWAEQVKPRVIFLENVREFSSFGPCVPLYQCVDCNWKGTEGQAILMRVNRKCPRCESKRLRATDALVPCPERKGATFKRFISRLENLGYEVQWKNLNAADYGAPTHRRRLFLIARRDGQEIVWPEPTHASPDKCDAMPLFGSLKPYRTAAECIDWSIPCPSIFERKKPLADKTLRRIAMGIKRYVLDNPKPYIVQVAHGDGKNGRWGSGSNSVEVPLGTISGSNNHAIVTPVLSKYHGAKTDNDSRCKDFTEPFNTLDTQPRFAVVAPLITKFRNGSDGQSISEPMPTVTANSFIKRPGGCAPIGLVSAFIAKHFGGNESPGSSLNRPLDTVTSKDHNHLVAASLVHFNHGGKQCSGVEEPARTVTSNNHAALVYAFMIQYFGTSIGSNVHDPVPTATTKDRYGLVTVTIDGEPYVIVDIGMRMLTPRELARAQGFPDTYELTGTKTSQVARIGNSVCPVMSKVLVEANYESKTKEPVA